MNRAEKRRQQKLDQKNRRLTPANGRPAGNAPDIQQALDLAVQHHTAGRLPEAESIYQQILQTNPGQPIALHLLGVIAHQAGRNDVAVDLIKRALAIEPDYAEAHNNLGAALQDLGKLEDAFAARRRAVALNPKNNLFGAGLARSLESLSFDSIDDNLLHDLLQLLERPRVRPSYVIRPIVSALRHHPDFSRILELAVSEKPEIEFAYGDVAERLSVVPLFLRIMGLSPIYDLKIERMLTFLRYAMTKETVAKKSDEKGLPFSTALALQCFINEYVFLETDEEKATVEDLQEQIATLVEKKRDVPPSFIATLGAYRPLCGFPWAQELSEREWAGDIKEVIERQISEPLIEKSLRSRIASLTSIQNTVSQSVRKQYEENPYPRWIKTDLRDKGEPIGFVCRGPHFA